MEATNHTAQHHQMLTRKELAARWSVCVESLKRWEKAGKLKGIKVGPRLTRYRMDEVLRFEQNSGFNKPGM